MPAAGAVHPPRARGRSLDLRVRGPGQPRSVPALGHHDGQRETGRPRRTLGGGGRHRHGGLGRGGQNRAQAPLPPARRPLQQRCRRKPGVRLRCGRLLLPRERDPGTAGRNAPLPGCRVPSGEDQDRRGLPGGRPEKDRGGSFPGGRRRPPCCRRERPLPSRRCGEVRRSSWPLRPALVRGARRPARLPAPRRSGGPIPGSHRHRGKPILHAGYEEPAASRGAQEGQGHPPDGSGSVLRPGGISSDARGAGRDGLVT